MTRASWTAVGSASDAVGASIADRAVRSGINARVPQDTRARDSGLGRGSIAVPSSTVCSTNGVGRASAPSIHAATSARRTIENSPYRSTLPASPGRRSVHERHRTHRQPVESTRRELSLHLGEVSIGDADVARSDHPAYGRRELGDALGDAAGADRDDSLSLRRWSSPGRAATRRAS